MSKSTKLTKLIKLARTQLARTQLASLASTLERLELELELDDGPPLLASDRDRRRWTVADDAVVRKMLDERATNTDIARALGRTYQAVSQRIHRLRRQEGRPR